MIRYVEVSELAQYRELRLHALKESPEAFGSDYTESEKRPIESFLPMVEMPRTEAFLLGAFEKGELVGIVSFRRRLGIKMRHKAEINQMFVLPRCRGKGVGRQLLERLISLAGLIEGIESLLLAVIDKNEAAMMLYRSLGFDVYGNEARALCVSGTYYDEVLMEKHFS